MILHSRRLPYYCFSLFFICTSVFAQDGPLVVSQSGHWFEYRDSGKAFFMAGSGGPEGFFYETDARKQTIVDDLIRTGANARLVIPMVTLVADR